MKKIITACFIVLSAYYAQAQSTDSTAKKMYWWQLAVGGALDLADNMKSELNTPTINSKGTAVKFSNYSTVLSARLGGSRNLLEGLMIGGNLTYDMFMPKTISGLADISAARYGANITLGPTFAYKGTILNPYAGVGYAYEILTVKNISPNSTVNFDLNQPIATGQKKNYTTDYVLFELGLGVKKALSSNVAIGADAGLYFSPTFGGSWKDGSTEITSRKAPGSSGGFLRLTLAYGRFK